MREDYIEDPSRGCYWTGYMESEPQVYLFPWLYVPALYTKDDTRCYISDYGINLYNHNIGLNIYPEFNFMITPIVDQSVFKNRVTEKGEKFFLVTYVDS